MNNESDSSSSDDWANEELVIPEGTVENPKDTVHAGEEWLVAMPDSQVSTQGRTPTSNNEGNPMIIVDMTKLSDGAIHSRFDASSVNDPEEASKLRKQIESDFERYSKDSVLLAEGSIIPCGSSVWRSALAKLRKERRGHYFAPIFPAKCLS